MSEVKSDKFRGRIDSWQSGQAKTVTFMLTEKCNLRCEYCYFKHDGSGTMSWDIAKKAVDYILSEPSFAEYPSVIWEFVGGEPFLEIDLMDSITDYIKRQMFMYDHPWFGSYRISISTNGLLYGTTPVQNFIAKNASHLSIGISLDGSKTKHDLSRKKCDGTGSFDDVIKNCKLWLKQFPNASVKSTFSHQDLPYLKESIVFLWAFGISEVAANVVFEDVWNDGDDLLFEEQLIALADHVLDNSLYGKVNCSLFSDLIGQPSLNPELFTKAAAKL